MRVDANAISNDSAPIGVGTKKCVAVAGGACSVAFASGDSDGDEFGTFVCVATTIGSKLFVPGGVANKFWAVTDKSPGK